MESRVQNYWYAQTLVGNLRVIVSFAPLVMHDFGVLLLSFGKKTVKAYDLEESTNQVIHQVHFRTIPDPFDSPLESMNISDSCTLRWGNGWLCLVYAAVVYLVTSFPSCRSVNLESERQKTITSWNSGIETTCSMGTLSTEGGW